MILWRYFFFNDTATTEIYTLSLHDALPICRGLGQRRAAAGARLHGRSGGRRVQRAEPGGADARRPPRRRVSDRKSTRLNSSHANISYAVFCLKKKIFQEFIALSTPYMSSII